MDVIEIVRRVRNLAGDVSAQQFDNSSLVDWINSACRQAAIDNSLIQVTGSTALASGNSEVTLPERIFKIHNISIDGEGIKLSSYQDFLERNDDLVGNSDGRGKPQLAYQWEGKLFVFPAPDKDYTLKIYYIGLPEKIVDNGDSNFTPNELPIPESYHDRIVTYCLAQVAYQDDDMNKYNSLMLEFNTGVTSTAHSGQSEENLYPFMAVSARDGGGFYEGLSDY